MFNLRLCNAATIRYSLLKFWCMHLCGKGYKYFSPHCCKCNSFGCIAAIKCGNACHGPHSDSVYSGSVHRQFNSPRLAGLGYSYSVLVLAVLEYLICCTCTVLILVSYKVIVLVLVLVLVDKYSGTRVSTGTSTDILWYICDVRVKTIISVK